MAIFILVHGSWHGGWCWEKIVPGLEAVGHTAIAPDLPGMGSDKTPLSETPLRDWIDFIVDIVRNQNERVILVGHSRGGVVISQVAERIPDHISRLVYVTAFLLQDGQSLAEIASQQVEGDTAPPLPILFAEDGMSCTIETDQVGPAFYGHCTEEQVTKVLSLLTPEPTAILNVPVSITSGNFGSIPRAYIEAADDQAIDIRKQRRMHDALPCNPVLTLESDHSPFYSMPDQLVEMLNSMA